MHKSASLKESLDSSDCNEQFGKSGFRFKDFFAHALFVSYTGRFLVYEPFREKLGKLPVIASGNTFSVSLVLQVTELQFKVALVLKP